MWIFTSIPTRGFRCETFSARRWETSGLCWCSHKLYFTSLEALCGSIKWCVDVSSLLVFITSVLHQVFIKLWACFCILCVFLSLPLLIFFLKSRKKSFQRKNPFRNVTILTNTSNIVPIYMEIIYQMLHQCFFAFILSQILRQLIISTFPYWREQLNLPVSLRECQSVDGASVY